MAGAGVYSSTCQACHGSDGVGIDGLGKALAASDFVQSLSDDELATMIKVGREQQRSGEYDRLCRRKAGIRR